MNYNVVLKTIPARKVISYRAIIPNYQSEGMLWEVMFREVTKQNVKFAADPLSMAIFHDKEYKESDVDVEVQNAVVGDYASTEEVKFYESGAIEVASVTFHGGFEQMPAVSQAAAEWIDKNAYVLAGPMLNIYHVGPAQDNNPENWVTEACYTIKKV